MSKIVKFSDEQHAELCGLLAHPNPAAYHINSRLASAEALAREHLHGDDEEEEDEEDEHADGPEGSADNDPEWCHDEAMCSLGNDPPELRLPIELCP